jgi:hypothetical protein
LHIVVSRTEPGLRTTIFFMVVGLTVAFMTFTSSVRRWIRRSVPFHRDRQMERDPGRALRRFAPSQRSADERPNRAIPRHARHKGKPSEKSILICSTDRQIPLPAAGVIDMLGRTTFEDVSTAPRAARAGRASNTASPASAPPHCSARHSPNQPWRHRRVPRQRPASALFAPKDPCRWRPCLTVRPPQSLSNVDHRRGTW